MLHKVYGSGILALAAVLMWTAQFAAAPYAEANDSAPQQSAPTEPFVLGPPMEDGPVVVWAGFQLQNINNIDDEGQTFEFTGVLTLRWQDKRQAFDSATVGVDEKVFQGNYQFNELSPGWFPQEILVNESGMYEKDAVVLRQQPDGTAVLVQTVSAVAKVEFDVRRFPFDKHRLEAVFELLGFDQSEVVLRAESEAADVPDDMVQVPQWTIEAVALSTRNRSASVAGRPGGASALVLSVDVRRQSFFILRLVVFPLMAVVLLSFCVFWMDRSSVGDRISVSFIGILTGVAYQIVMSDIMPHISSFTMINAFLNISFFTMSATVVINLVVGALDKKGMREAGDRLDRRCRWIFPLAYFGFNLLVAGAAVLFF